MLVTSASEKFFSAGADVSAFAAGTPRSRIDDRALAHEAFRKMENTPIMFIAAIAGHCLGGGSSSRSRATFGSRPRARIQIGLPEVNLGLFPGSAGRSGCRGSSVCQRARHDRQCDDDDAGRGEGGGLVDRCSQTPPPASRGRSTADEVAAGPSVALGHAKLAITQGFGAPLDLGLAMEREAISRVFVSRDADEGIKAFGEKRKPEFKGD